MRSGSTAVPLREELREKTASLHIQTENALDLMGPSVTLERYLAVLRLLHSVYAKLEPAILDHAGWNELGLDMGARRKLPLLEADLAFIEGRLAVAKTERSPTASPTSCEPATLPLESFAAALGAAYVIEGSTLGGAFIRRHLSTLFRLDGGQGTRFFNCYGTETGARWKQFLEALERAPLDAEGRQRALAGAVRTFELLLGHAASIRA